MNIWDNIELIEVSNDTIKLGDIVSRDPSTVYPVVDSYDKLLRIVGCWEVNKVYSQKDEGNIYLGIDGVSNSYKRLLGKPIYKLVSRESLSLQGLI